MKKVVFALVIMFLITLTLGVSGELMTVVSFKERFFTAREHYTKTNNLSPLKINERVQTNAEGQTMLTLSNDEISVQALTFKNDDTIKAAGVLMNGGLSEESTYDVMSFVYALSTFDEYGEDFNVFLQETLNSQGKPIWHNGFQIELSYTSGGFAHILFKYVGADSNAQTTTLSSGEYIVGQHIPAGEYSASTVAISVNLSTRRDGKLRINEVLSPTNPIGRMVLQDGDEIEISGGAVTFTPLK